MGEIATLPPQEAFREYQAGELVKETEAFLRDQAAQNQASKPEITVVGKAEIPTDLPVQERVLTEADNLNRNRLPDGSHSPWVLDELLKNLVPYVKESGMPSAVSEVYQNYVENHEDEHGRRNTFMWLGQTALQTAVSGKRFHKAPEAHKRVDVEIEEAKDGDISMCPGYAKSFWSPKMSEADASRETAQAENLANDDSLRMYWLDVDGKGKIKGRHMQSILVSDVPLEAWVSLLADPHNIFGKAIPVENPKSALSVMKVFRELELPREKLPEGVVTYVKEVIPYVKDPDTRAKVVRQYEDFQKDQALKHERAVGIAKRWRTFEMALSDGLFQGWVNPSSEVAKFAYQMSEKWSDEHAAVIRQHQLDDGGLRMTRKLAVLLETAKQKLFRDEASIVNGERHAQKQLEPEVLVDIQERAKKIQQFYDAGKMQEANRLEVINNQHIAGQNMKGSGGGCPGENDMQFQAERNLFDNKEKSTAEMRAEQKKWKKTRGACAIKSCPTRPGVVELGPCGVCMGRCQEIYNEGGDPTKGQGIVLKMVISI